MRHGDLCYGCGQANVFGLQLELEPAGDDAAAGRFFVKQDHQGPRGDAHAGVLAAALLEAMALCARAASPPRRLEVELTGSAPVGTFVELTARVERRTAEAVEVVAEASGERGALASARATFPV